MWVCGRVCGLVRVCRVVRAVLRCVCVCMRVYLRARRMYLSATPSKSGIPL